MEPNRPDDVAAMLLDKKQRLEKERPEGKCRTAPSGRRRMEKEQLEALRRYHSERCRQETLGLHAARSPGAADAHLGMLKLHELMYYDLVLPTFVAAQPDDNPDGTL
jgi:hypothetical protein